MGMREERREEGHPHFRVVSEGFPVVGVVCRNYYDMVLFCFPADSTMATVSTAGSTMATVSIVTLVLVTFLTMLFV